MGIMVRRLGKSLVLEVFVSAAGICGAYTLMRKSPRRWRLWFWVISLPFVVFFVFLAPLVIDPMFNRFDPLQQRHAELVTEIERVVHHGGSTIPRSKRFLMMKESGAAKAAEAPRKISIVVNWLEELKQRVLKKQFAK
jgi:STE24 endopeptidase